ncbi:MAG: arsenate reductase ArsC [Magnetococcales bacterium]|nr:arsenate reductase ArsC [Magnetococcales bacterium]
MTAKRRSILVLCTGNSARSIMAEALINTLGEGRFQAYSAGSHPAGKVNPLAIEQVSSLGYPTETLRSKSWDEFSRPAAPPMDIVITVCDNAAGEVCPLWPGEPIAAHWSFTDPAAVTGSDDVKRQAFAKTFHHIKKRVQAFLALKIDWHDIPAAKEALARIGHLPDDRE